MDGGGGGGGTSSKVGGAFGIRCRVCCADCEPDRRLPCCADVIARFLCSLGKPEALRFPCWADAKKLCLTRLLRVDTVSCNLKHDGMANACKLLRTSFMLFILRHESLLLIKTGQHFVSRQSVQSHKPSAGLHLHG